MRPIIARTDRAYVMLLKGEEALLIRNWLGRQEPHLPGGGIKKNESPAHAAARELEEELGIIVNNSSLSKLNSGRWLTDKLRFSYTIFMAEFPQDQTIKARKFEIISHAWIGLDDLAAAGSPAEIIEAAGRAGTSAKR